MPQPKALIFSAPSGSGKTTIVHHLMGKYPTLGFSISATTRPRRSHEIHGQDYYFLSPQEFRDKLSQNAFVEHEEVYQDRYYGTLKSELDRLWNQGKIVVFDVDVVGGQALKKYFGDEALAVFVKVSELAVIEKRLRARNTEDEESLKMRLSKLEQEWRSERHFDVVVVNDELESAFQQAEVVVGDFLQGIITS
ncbi:MAG TPA: guanylate kinase [Cytophagales bacterium]|nr:guanylate kinase [Cytophagales bacterium]HAA17384.1 guanylate kinase [Cytophagales bacterium]HAP61748.1 guanylate kinase [Cytophagales bacterium]